MIFPSRWLYGILLSLGIASGGYYGHQTWQAAKLPPKEKVLILRGLTHYDPSGWPAKELKTALEKEGYDVVIGNHTEGKWLASSQYEVIIGHSMGANAALKAVNRWIKDCDTEHKKTDLRKVCYQTKLPRLVVSLDAGKWPLHSHGPTHQATRCVSLHGGLRPIGGQRVLSNCVNYLQKGVPHSTFPQAPKVINTVVKVTNIGRPQ